MTYYAIRSDGYRFQELDLEVSDILDNFPEDASYQQAQYFFRENIAFAPWWKTIRTGFKPIDGQENLIPEISRWVGATLFLSPDAYRYVGEMLSPFGEFLPVLIGDETFQLFNCLTVVDAVPDSDPVNIAFASDAVQDAIVFKTMANFGYEIYCTERFKAIVESYGLQGIVFDEFLGDPMIGKGPPVQAG